MTDERFEELMRDAAATYRRPPNAPLEEMWASIEAELDASKTGVAVRPMRQWTARRVLSSQWARFAAVLVIGVGIGRVWTIRQPVASEAAAPIGVVDGGSSTASRPSTLAYDAATTRYLGQTAALLVALPSEMRGGHTDQQFMTRAGDLLLTTRMLIDSPASTDPSMRNLLEDLELVLAQIVRLQNERGRTELDLINQALEQRDVLPRLRSAVAEISAD